MITLTANYRDTLAPETVAEIDRLVEDQCALDDILIFIDENSEEDFRNYYELYVELGEQYGYEAVDYYSSGDGELSDLDHFENAYMGWYQSPESMAEDYFDGETDRLDYRISVNWEETADYLLAHDVDRFGDHYFRCSW
jgi:hypothetical protein